MKNYFYLIIGLSLLPLKNYAQFSDSLSKRLQLNASGSVNKTNDGSNYLLNNLAKFQIRKARLAFNSHVNYIYGQSPDKLINNDVGAGFDFNWYSKQPKFYYWGLFNFTSSYSLNVRSQYQTGLGVAYNLLRDDTWRLNISNGFIYEYSHIVNKENNEEQYGTLRNSLRIQGGYSFNNKLKINTIFYYQPSLLHKNDYLISNESNLNFQVFKWMSLNMKLVYNNISRTQKENLIWSYGILIDHLF